MDLPLVIVPSSGIGTCKPVQLRFHLQVFERMLREALGVDAKRPCGQPGSDDRPIGGNPGVFAVEYLIDSLMSKFDDGETGKTLKAEAAFKKFLEAEEICFFRNLYFSQDTAELERDSGLRAARQHFADLVGKEVDPERIARGFGWGPGASTRLARRKGDHCYKYSGTPEVTPNAYALGCAVIQCNPLWKQSVPLGGLPASVWGSRMDTVAKNYKIDRTICIEPDLNMFVQKGVGAFLRQRLRAKGGINLDSQDANREGARDLSLATIDFSMASDSVSQGLVRFLSPAFLLDWIQWTRSEFTVFPDKTLHRLSKVSSMGNGFTFELETAIFLSLARAVVPQCEWSRILVYGDDVLLPVAYADDYLQLCHKAGFTPNRDKTHTEGPFRESCGMHVHSGFDVTPFFIRRPVNDLPELFLLHNNLRRWRDRVDPLLSSRQYDSVTRLLRSLRRLAPSEWRRPRLPDGYGDGAFIGSFAEVQPRLHRDKHGYTGWEYFSSVVILEQAEERQTRVPGLLVKALTQGGPQEILPGIFERVARVLPSKSRGYRATRVAIPWTAFG